MKLNFKAVLATGTVAVAVVAGMVGGALASAPAAQVGVHSVSVEAGLPDEVETPAPVAVVETAEILESAPVNVPAEQESVPAVQNEVPQIEVPVGRDDSKAADSVKPWVAPKDTLKPGTKTAPAPVVQETVPQAEVSEVVAEEPQPEPVKQEEAPVQQTTPCGGLICDKEISPGPSQPILTGKH